MGSRFGPLLNRHRRFLGVIFEDERDRVEGVTEDGENGDVVFVCQLCDRFVSRSGVGTRILPPNISLA